MTPTRMIPRGPIRLAAYEWGRPTADRPTIVLVHGYPDSAQVWAEVAERLAERFHVVAYDVRGAGQSDAPSGRAGYRMLELVADLAAVLDAMAPGRRVHLVGHDWGSIQSWESVCTAPMSGRILSYTSISGPCLDHVGHWLREHARPGFRGRQLLGQLGRSWYIAAFHAPLLAPTAWRLGVGRAWPRLVRALDGTPLAPSDTQVRDGGNGVNLYRANVLPRLLRPETRRAVAPVQLLIPLRDRFVSPNLYENLSRWVPVLRRRAIDAGHWVMASHPDKVADCIADWALEHDPQARARAA